MYLQCYQLISEKFSVFDMLLHRTNSIIIVASALTSIMKDQVCLIL